MATKRLISFGPKDFLKGIGPQQVQQNEMGGFFATMHGIDLYRKPGFISPGSVGSLFTNYSTLDNTLFSIDGHYYNITQAVDVIYGRTNTSFYKFDLNTSPPTLVTSYLGFPYATGDNAGYGFSIINMGINGKTETLVFLNADIGKFDGASYNSTWGSTVPSGATALQSGVIKRAVQYSAYVYFTNGGYIGMIDGTTTTGGTNGTLYDKKLTLPLGYTAKDIRVVQGYLEIYIDDGTQAQVWIWDGISILPLDIVFLEDQRINAGFLSNGIPHVFTNGQGTGLSVRQKNFYGYPQLQNINTNNAGNVTAAMIDRVNSTMIWSDFSKIWMYGNPYSQYSYRGQDANSQFPEALTCPIIPRGGNITALRAVNGQILVGSNNGSYYYVESFTLNDSTYDNAATWQTNFIDLPDDTSIDFIRFVVQPPASGASFTPTLFTDYGTSGTAMAALTSTNLDANGKSKTYYSDQFGAPICDNFAIGGAYTGSSTSNPVIITRIDIGVSIK